jgi:glycosyltransferase involved in cell wall biosynthesis
LFAKYFVRACDDFVVMSKAVGEEIRGFLLLASLVNPTPDTSPKREESRSAFRDNVAAPLPFRGGVGGGVDKGGAIRYNPHPIYDIYGKPLEKTAARQKLNLPPEAPVALFFGLIRKYKGLDLLLEALAQAPDIHALIAGECYDDWGFYQKIIEENGLAERVHLHLNFIPTEQVRVFFSAADLVVQPYRSATQSGISQIAYHFEKPMIVTNVGGLPEIVSEGVSGYVVPPEPTAIAAAMRDFFENDRAAAMQVGVREEKKRFSWENLVAQLTSFVE